MLDRRASRAKLMEGIVDQFASKVALQMSIYKKEKLGISGKYIWDGVEYDHILPQDLWYENILKTIREDFLVYLNNSNRIIKLHHKFHHMNSSQAMCFNLFFPLFLNNELGKFASYIGLESWNTKAFEFEKTIDIKEGTNFDLYLESNTNNRIFIETKYTESEFGKGSEKKHKEKHDEIYKRMLFGILPESIIDSQLFYKYYQLFRNLSYLSYCKDESTNNHVCIVTTKYNTKILDQYNEVISFVNSEYKNMIHYIEIEELIPYLTVSCSANLNECLNEFSDKYLIKN